MDYSTFFNKRVTKFVADSRLQIQPNETQGTESGELPVTIRFGGYWVSVDASQYSRVVLTMANGSTEEFTGRYANQTTFAHRSFRGQDRTSESNPADEVFNQFNGPITEVRVESSEASATAQNPTNDAPTDVQVDCSEVTLEGDRIFLAAFWLEFTDGSRKEYSEADFGSTITIGSGGRVIDTAYLRLYGDQSEYIGWFAFENPNPRCDPGEPTTVFDCTQVQLTPEENLDNNTEQVPPVNLQFIDGTEEEVPGSDTDLPDKYAGSGDNTGKVIEAIEVYRRDWGGYYYLVNPDVESCTNSQQNFAVQFDCYAVVVDGESYDRVELETVNATETFEGDFSGETRFGFFGEYTLRNQDAPNRTYSNFSGPIVRVEVFDGDTSQVFEADSVEDCWFNDAQIECSTITFDRYLDGDFRARFPNAYKRWDGPKDGTQAFGSPGRTMTSFSDENAAIYVIDDTERSCDPASDIASTFDCTTFAIEPAEFVDSEPSFNSIRLQFTDGATQQIGSNSDSEEFTAPETFAGSDEHEGKVIESVRVFSNNGDVFFEFSNPDAGDCSGRDDSQQPVNNRSSPLSGDDSSVGSSSDNSTISPTSYSYYPALTIGGEDYYVLRNLELPNESATWAVVRGSINREEHQLASLDTAINAFEMLSWQQRPDRDYEALKQEAEDLINKWQRAKFWNELAQLGVDLGVVIALLKTGNAKLAIGTVIETIEDVASWTWETAANPYQEVYSRIEEVMITQNRVKDLVRDIEQISDTPQTIANVVDTAVSVHQSEKPAIEAGSYTATVLGSMAAGDSVYEALGKGHDANSILFADRDTLISKTVQVGSNGYEAFAKVGGIAIGMHKARIPLLRRLSKLQQKANQGTLTFHGEDSIFEFYTAEVNHDMISAVGNAGMYTVANESSNSWAGPIYDIMTNMDTIASASQEAKKSYLDSAAVVHDLAGQRFYIAGKRLGNSVNFARAEQTASQNKWVSNTNDR